MTGENTQNSQQQQQQNQQQQQQQQSGNSGSNLPDPNPQTLDRAETPRDLKKR